jgi:cytochrome P450
MTTTQTPTSTPPGPKGLPLIGNLLDMRRDGPFGFYRDVWQEYGDIATASIGPMQFLVLARPEHIQHVLIKNPDKYIKGISHEKLRTAIGDGILTLEGERWLRQRRLMQPTYTPKNVRQFADIMTEESQALINRWQSELPTNAVVDINQEMVRVTIKVISRAVFGLDIDDGFNDAAQSLYTLLEYTSQSSISMVDVPLFIPTPRNRQLKKAQRYLRDFLMNIIESRRMHGLQDDLLSMLMTSRDADTGEFMSDDELHDEVLITFFAGHETTASLLTWTSYLLSLNPDVEAKLHAELDNVLAGRVPTQEDVPKLSYTRMVLDEALRLYSPVPIMARDAAEDDEIGGYPVAKGTMVVLLPYATHRHPEFWEKPSEFYPEHFLPEAVAARPRYAYLPFGSGQRICIGLHFAQLEATLLLADIAQRFRFRLAAPHDGAFEYIGVARPAKPIMMRLERRDVVKN